MPEPKVSIKLPTLKSLQQRMLGLDKAILAIRQARVETYELIEAVRKANLESRKAKLESKNHAKPAA